MPSIADTAARVVAAGAPALFLDTCNILDIIRAPVRALSGCVEAATELVAGAPAAAPRFNLIVGSFVPGEFAANSPTVADTLTAHLDRMDEQADHFHGLCGHLGIAPGFGRPGYRATAFAGRLLDLSRDLLAAAVVLDTDPDALARAVARVTGAPPRRPSRNAGQLKDCVIFEEYLEVCRQVRATTFAGKLVFCSSNTADYCDGKVAHPDIAADCAAVGLAFTTNLPWAVAELKS